MPDWAAYWNPNISRTHRNVTEYQKVATAELALNVLTAQIRILIISLLVSDCLFRQLMLTFDKDASIFLKAQYLTFEGSC